MAASEAQAWIAPNGAHWSSPLPAFTVATCTQHWMRRSSIIVLTSMNGLTEIRSVRLTTAPISWSSTRSAAVIVSVVNTSAAASRSTARSSKPDVGAAVVRRGPGRPKLEDQAADDGTGADLTGRWVVGPPW